MFLTTINHLWKRARQHDIRAAGFGLKEILMIDTPKTFPPSGIQLGGFYPQCGWSGLVTLTDWTSSVDVGAPCAHGRVEAEPRDSGRSDIGPPLNGERSAVTGEKNQESAAELEEIRTINRRLDAMLAKAAKP